MYCAMYVMRLLNSRSVIDVSIWFCVMVAVLNHAMFTYLFLRREYLLPGSTSPERPIMIVRISISHSHLFNKLENHIAFMYTYSCSLSLFTHLPKSCSLERNFEADRSTARRSLTKMLDRNRKRYATTSTVTFVTLRKPQCMSQRHT